MASPALDPLARAVAALTYDHIERLDPTSGRTLAEGDAIPLLQRSIGQDLRGIEAQLGLKAKGQTLLSATAGAIDEALLAIAEAQAALGGTSGASQ